MNRWLLAALALLPGAQEPAPTVIARDAIQPCLAAGADGAFYCAFIRGGNIEISSSTDGGKTWSEPVTAIDAKGNARGGMQRGPRLGVDAKGNVTVTAPICFDAAELTKQYPRAELWVARSTDGGKTFGAPVQVNERKGTAPESLHALAVAADGAAHVAWLDIRGRQRGQDLYYARVVDGKPGPNVKLGSTLCECCAPGIALDGAGNPALTWRDGATSENRPIWISLSKDGGKSFSAPAKLNQVETRVAG